MGHVNNVDTTGEPGAAISNIFSRRVQNLGTDDSEPALISCFGRVRNLASI